MMSNALLLLPSVLLGLIFLVPVRIRPGIVFGVSVPVDFAEGPEGLRIRRDYRTRGAITFLIAFTIGIGLLRQGHPAMLGFVLGGQVVCNIANWLLAVRQTRRFAVEAPLVRTASLDTHRAVGVEWLTGFALSLPLIFAGIYLHLNWEKIPTRFPIHWGVDGVANGWASRGIFGVYGALFAGVCSVCLLLLVRWFLARSPGASGRRRLYSRFMLVIAACISVTMAFVSLLPLQHTTGTTEMQDGLTISIIAVIGVAAIFIFLMVRMQVRQGETGEPYDGTPDKCWHGGQLYYNPQDRAIFVEKRFGIGYTLNFAHPASWVFMAVVLGLVIVPLVHALLQ